MNASLSNHKPRVQRSERYLAAARRIHSGQSIGCCSAITIATWECAISVRRDMRREFAEWFDEAGGRYGYWWYDNEREPRILALCFMAAIAEDEERHGRR